ncbi:hypothetical protein DSO57_1022921 [Entomophthora muscae]|uniref:Uncharacterized protein n=1 Tax=Entomophthora muscae TaxID=34485 RepID=A0ACC2TE38_9FUNG|nr:hypothetical protein DSO57_1022921 [Entomophthora muscae]
MKRALSADELLATQIAYQGAFRILFLSLVPISILGLAASVCTSAVPEKSPNN